MFFTEIEETNKNIGMIPFEEQSKGFQWFFSFDLHFMHDSDGTFEGCVLLLDEPGLHLHPGGQADLLERLDAYAKKNTLIYTTHLPFLVDLREPERIKVINQTESGAVVSNDLGGTQTDERLTLQAALGMRANQSYLVSERNLLVEGVHDYWIVAALSNIFEREGLACLPEDVLITAAGGASEIVPTATFMIGQHLNVVALFDSDSAGKEAEKKLREKWITRYKDARAVTLLVGNELGMPGKEATIEDIFADAEAYYMKKVCESHEMKLKSKGLATDAITLSGSGPILPRLHQCFNTALLHESSRARTMPTDKILTCRCGTTLVGRGRSSDSRSHSRGRPHSPAQLDSGREGHRRWRTAWRTTCQAAGVPTRCLHDCRRTAARTLIRASVPERVALRLTGHKSRTIFDRDHIIHEQELLDAAQRVANLARQAQAPRRRAHLTDKPCIGPRTAKPTGGPRRAIPPRRPHPPPRLTNPPTPPRGAPGAGTRMPSAPAHLRADPGGPQRRLPPGLSGPAVPVPEPRPRPDRPSHLLGQTDVPAGSR